MNDRLHEFSKRKQVDNNQKNEGSSNYHSTTIDKLAAEVSPPRCSNGNTLITMPQNLSFIDNTEAVLSVVKKLSATARNKKTRKVILDYSNVNSLDLATECLLGIVAVEVTKEHAHKKKKLHFQGMYPNNASYKRLIKGIGIIKSLNIKHELLPAIEEEKLRIFKYANLNRRDEVGLDTADTNARISAKFVDHINACLSDNQRQLNVQAKMKLSEYTGEIIGNAEDHSGMYHWYIYGYITGASFYPSAVIRWANNAYGNVREVIGKPGVQLFLCRQIFIFRIRLFFICDAHKMQIALLNSKPIFGGAN